MTPAQIELLKVLIANERRFWLRMREFNETKHIMDYPENDIRGVEVGWGADSRTVKSLERMGLVETVDLGNGRGMAFLGTYRWDVEADRMFE